MCLSNDLITVRLVYMSKNMQSRLQFHDSLSETLASHTGSRVHWLTNGITNAIGRLVSHQNINFFWQIAPNFISICMLVSKTHLIIREGIRRPEYPQSLHLHIVMHQKGTNLL